MNDGLRAPAGVERDATIAALMKKVREQALDLADLTDALQMSKDHGNACEQRIAELLSTSLGMARGSPSRANLLKLQANSELSESPLPTRSPRAVASHTDLSVAKDEVRTTKQKLTDTQAVLAQTKATMEEYGRKNKLLEEHLRKKTDLLLVQKAQIEVADSEMVRLQKEKEYLTRSSQPNNLRRLNKSAAAVATANSHLLQEELRRLKAALKRTEHSQLLAGQREKVLLESLQQAEGQLAAMAFASSSAVIAVNQKEIDTPASTTEISIPKHLPSASIDSSTPAMKATTYIRSTSPCSPDSLCPHRDSRIAQSMMDADSLDEGRVQKFDTQTELDRLRADNERLLRLCEHVHEGVKSVDHVIEGGNFAWTDISARLQKSEQRVIDMDLYIKKLTGAGFKPSGNNVNWDEHLIEEESSETKVTDAPTQSNSMNRVQGLLQQTEQERNILVDYLSATKGEKEALGTQLAELEGRHASLLHLQHTTTEEHVACQSELAEMRKANNELSAKFMQSGIELANLRSHVSEIENALKEKTVEAVALSKETEELSQMQLQTLMTLKDSREKITHYEAELTKLNRSIMESGINSQNASRSGTPGPTLNVSSTVAYTPSMQEKVGSTLAGVNVQLLQSKLSEHERKYESTFKELATLRGHYDELRPRYQKLEVRAEEQELRIRTLVDELLILRPLKESLVRLGEEFSPESAAHVDRVPSSDSYRSQSRRDSILLGLRSQHPPAPVAPVVAAPAVVTSSIPELAWVHSSALSTVSPELQIRASRLAIFATNTYDERNELQKALDSANASLATESKASSETILVLRAQVQALQEQAHSFGTHAMTSVQQFTSQLHSSESESSARIRELERENGRLIRCRDTLDHLKYVVASSGGSGDINGGASTGMVLLKSHLPRLIDLNPRPASVPVTDIDSGRSLIASSDSDDEMDSLDEDQDGARNKNLSPPRNTKSSNRYLYINSPSRDARSRSQQGAVQSNLADDSKKGQHIPARPLVSSLTSAHAPILAPSPTPGINDLDIILTHFTDAMLSEVIGRAMLTLDGGLGPLGTGARTAQEDKARLTNRLKEQLQAAEVRISRAADEQTRLETVITTLQSEKTAAVNEKRRLASELEELLSLSEKQQILTSVQDGKLASYKKEKALKVAQINSLQQRDSAIKARLVVALRDYGSAGALVAAANACFGQRSSSTESSSSAYSYATYGEQSPVPEHFSPEMADAFKKISSVTGLERSTDMIQALVDLMSTMWRCLSNLVSVQQRRDPTHSHTSAHTLQSGHEHGSNHVVQQDNFRARSADSPPVGRGVSLKHNELSPSSKRDRGTAVVVPVLNVSQSHDRQSGVSGVSFDVASEGDRVAAAVSAMQGGTVNNAMSVAAQGQGKLVSSGAGAPDIYANLGVSGNSATSLSMLSVSHNSQSQQEQGVGAKSRVGRELMRRLPPSQENHLHSNDTTGLQSPATNLQNRLIEAKNKFTNLRESWA